MRATRPSSLVSVAVVAAVALAVAAATLLVPALEASFSARSNSRITTSWSASTVKVGQSATVRGRVTSRQLHRRTVSLYVNLKSGWRRVAGTRSGPRGYYTIKVPTSYYLSRPMQLRVSATKRAKAVASANRTFTVRPAFTPAGSSALWAPMRAGQEWRFNPCQVVTYRVNDSRATTGALADVQAAFARAHEATGIQFRYLGRTNSFPNSSMPFPADTNIVVAWGDDADTSWQLGDKVISTGGVLSSRAARDGQGAVQRIRRAGIVMNTAENAWLAQHAATKMRVRALVHEIGVSLGLGPVTARYQRMNEAVYPQDTVNWGAGDLAGLNRVGLVEGCLTDTR